MKPEQNSSGIFKNPYTLRAMIRMIQSSSASHAKAYFSESLEKSDYYLSDQELPGRYFGKLSKRLELGDTVTKESFFALCENKHPQTGKQLTPLTLSNRTVGYDINFHCPKSLSVVFALNNDPQILNAFQQSVRETMADIEQDCQTRVRKNGVYADRNTQELAWAEFIHQTARPVESELPDPHLHAHVFVVNATFDELEGRIKAAKFKEIKRSMPYYQARFQKRLADRMIDLGYQVRPTAHAFEIEGVPKEVINYFSKRTDQIGKVAAEKGIFDPRAKDKLGALTRSKKQKGFTMDELRDHWKAQLRQLTQDLNLDDSTPIRHPAPGKAQPDPERAEKHVDFALKHVFERASVMEERKLLQVAYKAAIGHRGVTLDALTDTLRQDKRVLRINDMGREFCTTKEVLQEEKRMVELARNGIARLAPLYSSPPSMDLKDDQKEAVSHILTTKNRVSIIMGGAGTGKTTLMKEAVRKIGHAGKKVIVTAPTAQAARGVLKSEGYEAETVAKLLVDKKLQESLQNQVLWVDEAGLLGTHDMRCLLELATEKNARVILSGDTRQHASVVRGDALRILNVVGKIESAYVRKIHRQKEADYRQVVAWLSRGDVGKAFTKLDQDGLIKSVDPLNPHESVVDDYLKSLKGGKTSLVICPTHKQGDEISGKIRERLKKVGKLGKKEVEVTRYTNLNYTEAEKSDPKNYQPGQVIQLNQNTTTLNRGSKWTIEEVGEKRLTLTNTAGKKQKISFSSASKFDVFEKATIPLSKGDKVMITRNGFDRNKKRLNNGMNLEVLRVSKNGQIELQTENGRSRFTLDQEYGHLNHAHCITSHASQGRTVDTVLIAQPSSTFGASDAKQFYVSVSRGKTGVKVYTDDKELLLETVSELGDRQSAHELVAKTKTHDKHVAIIRNQEQLKEAERQREFTITKHQNYERDYEPGI